MEENGTERRQTAREGERQAASLFGWIAALLGILAGLVAAAIAVFGLGLLNLMPTAFAGIALGVVGYFLGSRRLGAIAAVLGIAVLLLGLAGSQGVVPGLDTSDSVKELKQAPPENQKE